MGWWPVIKVIWGGLGFGLVCLILIAAWRARSVIAWNRDIRRELRALAVEAEASPPARRKGIQLIIGECEAIFHSFSPERSVSAERLHHFIRSMAACFFPDAERPELQIPLNHLIRSLDASLSRFDRILRRPGLKRIQSVNIRTLYGLYGWSRELLKHPLAQWYAAHRVGVQRFARLRLFIIPDPFSWVLFLSRKLLVLVLMKLLLVDIVLFAGKLALDAFDKEKSGSVEENAENLEETLNALSHVPVGPTADDDPDIVAIRRGLVGLPTMILSNPTWQDWKTAVQQAAQILARRHFPDSDRPLEEAVVGPLLDRTRSYLNTLAKGDRVIFVRSIYQMRLETLIQARDIKDLALTPMVRGIVRTGATTYGWIKWPLKIYRRIKRFSLPGVAMDLGWVLGKKTALALICGRTFDHACRELDWVYRASAAMKGTRPTGHPATDSASPEDRALPPADEFPPASD
jgi:hypothetical protein